MASRTVGHVKSIRYHRYRAGPVIEPPDLLLQARWRSEVLHITVRWIGEIDVFVLWVYADIVDRVELPAEVVVKNGYEGRDAW